MNAWATVMVIAGGLFAGGAASFAWSRVPIWRRMDVPQFLSDFGQTLAWTDKVQPALLVAAIISSTGFVLTTPAGPRLLALLGTIGFVVTLAASLMILVPLQRTILASSPTQVGGIEAMRQRWFRGNLGRAVLATAAFTASSAAAAM